MMQIIIRTFKYSYINFHNNNNNGNTDTNDSTPDRRAVLFCFVSFKRKPFKIKPPVHQSTYQYTYQSSYPPIYKSVY